MIFCIDKEGFSNLKVWTSYIYLLSMFTSNIWVCLTIFYIQYTNLLLSKYQLKTYTLAEIEIALQSHGSSLDDYPEMPSPNRALVPNINNRLIHSELNYNVDVLAKEHRRLMSTMTNEQRRIYDTIMERVDGNFPGFFFLIWVRRYWKNVYLEIIGY